MFFSSEGIPSFPIAALRGWPCNDVIPSLMAALAQAATEIAATKPAMRYIYRRPAQIRFPPAPHNLTSQSNCLPPLMKGVYGTKKNPPDACPTVPNQTGTGMGRICSRPLHLPTPSTASLAAPLASLIDGSMRGLLFGPGASIPLTRLKRRLRPSWSMVERAIGPVPPRRQPEAHPNSIPSGCPIGLVH